MPPRSSAQLCHSLLTRTPFLSLRTTCAVTSQHQFCWNRRHRCLSSAAFTSPAAASSAPHTPYAQFLPSSSSYGPPPTSAFCFCLLYRCPAHYAAFDRWDDSERPPQFILKLAQRQQTAALPPHLASSSSHGSTAADPYHLHELLLSAEVTVAEVERVMLSNFPFLAAVEMRSNGRTIPPEQQLYALYNKPALSFTLHPHQSPAYSLAINGGLPLSSGVRSYWRRSALLHASAVLMLLSVLSLLLGDSPERPARGEEETDWDRMTEQQKARAHWNMLVYDKSRDIADWLGIPPPPGYLTPEQREKKYREMHMKKHPQHAKQEEEEEEEEDEDDSEAEQGQEEEVEDAEPAMSLDADSGSSKQRTDAT